jgi:antitoxin ParD1/3/4
MAESDTITVALSEDITVLIRDAIDSGDYASVDEVVREALRDWKLKRQLAETELADMRRLVQEGAESGLGIDADLVFARLRAKYAAMTEE